MSATKTPSPDYLAGYRDGVVDTMRELLPCPKRKEQHSSSSPKTKTPTHPSKKAAANAPQRGGERP